MKPLSRFKPMQLVHEASASANWAKLLAKDKLKFLFDHDQSQRDLLNCLRLFRVCTSGE